MGTLTAVATSIGTLSQRILRRSAASRLVGCKRRPGWTARLGHHRPAFLAADVRRQLVSVDIQLRFSRRRPGIRVVVDLVNELVCWFSDLPATAYRGPRRLLGHLTIARSLLPASRRCTQPWAEVFQFTLWPIIRDGDSPRHGTSVGRPCHQMSPGDSPLGNMPRAAQRVPEGGGSVTRDSSQGCDRYRPRAQGQRRSPRLGSGAAAVRGRRRHGGTPGRRSRLRAGHRGHHLLHQALGQRRRPHLGSTVSDPTLSFDGNRLRTAICWRIGACSAPRKRATTTPAWERRSSACWWTALSCRSDRSATAASICSAAVRSSS